MDKYYEIFKIYISYDNNNDTLLNSIPHEILIPWMLIDKTTRLPFILSWIQLFEDNNRTRWDLNFINFIKQYTNSNLNLNDLNILRTRLYTIAPIIDHSEIDKYVEKQLSDLQEMLSNPNCV